MGLIYTGRGNISDRKMLILTSGFKGNHVNRTDSSFDPRQEIRKYNLVLSLKLETNEKLASG